MRIARTVMAVGLAAIMAACGTQALPEEVTAQAQASDGLSAQAVGTLKIYDSWKSGNATFECGQIGDYDGAYKVDAAAPNGTYTVDSYGHTVTISGSNGKTFNWSSNFPIGAVIVKAGRGANVWFYTPQATSGSGLYAYQNKDISHVTFCWQYQLDVSKTATTTYKRTYKWSIDKTSSVSARTLASGAKQEVPYSVTVSSTYTDSEWKVSGTITITNNTPITFTVSKVSDVISTAIAANVTCALPTVLAPGGSLKCTYTANLPDGSARVNTATVTYYKVAGKDRIGTATADVKFGAPSNEIDECLTVTDNAGTPSNPADDLKFTHCVKDGASKTFTYKLWVGPYQCIACDQTFYFTNTASFVTNDTCVTGKDSWTIKVTVLACNLGCTLTQGYWKTHSREGPAPYDDAWKSVGPNEEDTPFYISGQTWYQVYQTTPSVNAPYYNLAHQFMAAKLNFANGAASTAAVNAAVAWAETFFNTYKPSDTLSSTVASTALSNAKLLDDYNNGRLGIPHCP